MPWTWEDKKTLGVNHLERMAAIHREHERFARESAKRWIVTAERAAGTAEGYERAAREVVRGETSRSGSLADVYVPPITCGIAGANGMPCRRRVYVEGDRCWQHAALAALED